MEPEGSWETVSSPKLSILVATMGRRDEKFKRLIKNLKHQVSMYEGNIEIVAYWNNGELPIGDIRQALLEAATGDYVCFVDDDDLVPTYYCGEIMAAILEKPDYIGFKVKVFSNTMDRPMAFHSLRYPGWFQDEHGYYRGVTHLNPIRRDLALLGTFSTTERGGEDEAWAVSVRPHVKEEVFIDENNVLLPPRYRRLCLWWYKGVWDTCI